ncbi:Polyisoprenoid-binding protein YceI [Raineyella antarctica]|uniref:Polyisoprenoid-binding protein YceI n=1 Tax=Raineyella antarctica TaxID=1577474 RepID=A0A1G6HC85_9ACTN|nr:YceI family protein [Raineyella antarctica]SDB91801.1 Polyisoprenoid-binding protein YceI [Raineyella antarctica]
MTPATGPHRLGPDDTDLHLLTTVEGPMAKMGHELVLRIGRWEATVTVGDTPEATTLVFTADLTSLRVSGNRDRTKDVPAKDRTDIVGHAAKALQTQKYGQVNFRSTSAEGTWDAIILHGQLALHGQTQPQDFRVVAGDGAYELTGQITQTRYGIKPFAIMMGALKVGDVVEVQATAHF